MEFFFRIRFCISLRKCVAIGGFLLWNLGMFDIVNPFLLWNVCVLPRGTPYNGPYGEAPPERGTFLRLRYIKRIGISLYRKFSCSLATLLEVYKKVGKSVISVYSKA